MPSPFVIRRHTFPGQHIREYPRALANHQEDVLTIAANSYTPHEVDNGSIAGQLTIIGFHANAFTKEVYEPFFEALYHRLKSRYGLTIGSIWVADQASQGDSATVNDGLLGNDSHWFDHSRDILQMVNTFRSQMKRPIVAVAHSMGGTQAVATSIFHPRLFETIVLLDTAMTMTVAGTMNQMIQWALHKPQTFPSKAEAINFVRKTPLFQNWDPRVIDRYIDSAFHDAPTTLHPDSSTKPKTNNFSEMRATARPNVDNIALSCVSLTPVQRYNFPDIHPDSPNIAPVYNPQTNQAYRWLPSLRPPTLFVLAKGSKICPLSELEHRTNITGTGQGGSGGVAAGNVKAVTIKGGHFLPMTNVEGTAEVVGEWIAERLGKLRELEERSEREWEGKTRAEKQRLEPKALEVLRNWDGKPVRNPNALADGGRSKI